MYDNTDERKRMVQNWRGRRLVACRAIDLIEEVIDALGFDDGSQPPPERGFPAIPSALPAELKNQANLLLRMILIANDGHAPVSSLRRF